MFATKKASAEQFIELINTCAQKRDEMETPAWTNYIDYRIKYGINQSSSSISENMTKYNKTSSMRFPYGINFGTMVMNNRRNIPGCVVGVSKQEIVLAYNQELKLPNEKVTSEEFEKGLFSVI